MENLLALFKGLGIGFIAVGMLPYLIFKSSMGNTEIPVRAKDSREG